MINIQEIEIERGLILEYIPVEKQNAILAIENGSERRFHLLKAILIKRIGEEESEYIIGELFRVYEANNRNGFDMKTINYILNLMSDVTELISTESKKHGEVLTPNSLVKNILDELPQWVWHNPDLKWLDPANGTGIFTMDIYNRLMRGLVATIPDEKERRKHIVEKMIYVCDIQNVNNFLFICLIDLIDDVEVNVFYGDSLSEEFDFHMKNVWKVDRFDIVVGNPPYNNMIDLKFINKFYPLCDELIFVHPSTWLLDEKGKQKKFTETKKLIKYDLESIILFNGNGLFGISLFIPCVITHINRNKDDKRIYCNDMINGVELYYDDIEDINKYSNVDEYKSIKEKIKNKTISNIDDHKIFNLKHPRNAKNKKRIAEHTHLNTLGEYYICIAQIRGHVNISKGDGKSFEQLQNEKMLEDDFYTIVKRDHEVEREISNHMFYKFPIQEQADNFLKYLKTNFVRFCLSVYKNNSQLECGEMAFIPYLDYNIEWNDESLYKHFNLNEREIAFIEKNIPKYY